jgi:small-conductance mechanosensitive channel/CRP-like cAMP-binding protein
VSRPKTNNQFVAMLAAVTLVVMALMAAYYFDTTVTAYLTNGMGEGGSHASVTAIKFVLWATLALVIVRALSALIFSITFRIRKGYEAPSLIRNLFSIITFVICFVLIFNRFYPGINLGALFTTSAIFGVIIGLALQDTLGNLFAGISVHADKPFQVGDVIVVGQGRIGVVESITWRAVKLRTFQNHVLMLSNSSVAKEAIEVCPRNNLNARIVFFSTTYSDSPAKTIHLVREAIREANNVSPRIRPIVRIRNLGDSSIEWEVKYWLDDYAKYNDTDALVRQLIWYAFRRNNIQFAFPTRTIFMEQAETLDDMHRDARGFIDRLSAVDIFAPLSTDEMGLLAKASASHVFAPGEYVIRAGESGDSMFVVHRGSVKVQVNDNGTARSVAVLQEGDFFGEMALFTGEPRTANIVAAEETEVLEIGHDAMKHLFDTNPDLVDSLSHIIAERRVGLAASAETASRAEPDTAGILSSIKRFFGIS